MDLNLPATTRWPTKSTPARRRATPPALEPRQRLRAGGRHGPRAVTGDLMGQGHADRRPDHRRHHGGATAVGIRRCHQWRGRRGRLRERRTDRRRQRHRRHGHRRRRHVGGRPGGTSETGIVSEDALVGDDHRRQRRQHRERFCERGRRRAWSVTPPAASLSLPRRRP